MQELKVHIAGWPVPQPRMTRNSRWKFKSHPVWPWREKIQWAIKKELMKLKDFTLITTPVSIGFDFRIKRDGRFGDLDNYIKAAKDSTEGILVFNDKIIYRYLEPTRRLYAPEGESGGLSLLVRWQEDE